MKIVEQLERNDELGEPLPLREPVRPALFRRHLPALVPVAKEPRPRQTRTSQFCGLCSKLLSSRIPCNSHITKDRGTVYPSQNREGEIVGMRPKCAELGG